METQVMEELYEKIANKANEMIPEEWEKLSMYAEVSEGASEVYFYYYPKRKNTPIYSLDIVDIFEISEDEFDEMSMELNDYFEELREEFKRNKQEPWTSLTLMLESNGKFNIDYDYTDLSESDSYEQHIIWRYKYLGMQPSPDRKRDVKIIQDYLKKTNKVDE